MRPTTRARSALVAGLASAALLGAAGTPAVAAAPAASADHAGYDSFARLGYQKAVAVRVLKGVFERGTPTSSTATYAPTASSTTRSHRTAPRR
ncbi:hypothetical protein [Streptomyces stelliscabiei]|uniref:hypothetical protein n=1 Tax=Streptomyces stelliscabiei TaxID=146820 RepID=UPI002FF4283A